MGREGLEGRSRGSPGEQVSSEFFQGVMWGKGSRVGTELRE